MPHAQYLLRLTKIKLKKIDLSKRNLKPIILPPSILGFVSVWSRNHLGANCFCVLSIFFFFCFLQSQYATCHLSLTRSLVKRRTTVTHSQCYQRYLFWSAITGPGWTFPSGRYAVGHFVWGCCYRSLNGDSDVAVDRYFSVGRWKIR